LALLNKKKNIFKPFFFNRLEFTFIGNVRRYEAKLASLRQIKKALLFKIFVSPSASAIFCDGLVKKYVYIRNF
jgi:hypothetical protein